MDSQRFDHPIQELVHKDFPALIDAFGESGWLWIKAQAWVESRLNPDAVSPVGAAGLMQLMPATDREIDGDIDGCKDPIGNLDNGIQYMAMLYSHFGEIPSSLERIRFAHASYNGGRGYVNTALSIAREAEGLPGPYGLWAGSGRPSGRWQTWEFTKYLLRNPLCRVKGSRPDFQQMEDYVDRIGKRYGEYLDIAQNSR